MIPSGITAFSISAMTAFIAYLIFRTKKLTVAKEKYQNNVAPWTLGLSTLIALSSVQYVLKNSSFLLKNFAQRTIGIVVLEGIDASFRSSLYVILIILFILVFSFSFYIYSKNDAVLSKYLKSGGAGNEGKMLFSLSLLSIFTLIFHYLNGAMIFVNIFNILSFLLLLTYLVLLAKIFFKDKNKLFFSLLNNYNFVILSFLVPTVIFFVRWVFVNGSYIFNYKYFYFFIPLWFVFWLVSYLVIKSFPKDKTSATINAILSASVPFLLIPISIPISNEVQFSLSRALSLSASSMSILFIFILLTFSVFLFIRKEISQINDKPFSFAGNYYLPILVATATMFNVYKNFIELPVLVDMFHHGENLLPTQQLFSFKSISFINIYPTHGISYLLGQVLYSLINGYRAFEPWLWEWPTKIFEILLLYFVLKKITNSFFASAAIIFLPLIGIFGGHPFTYGYNTSLVSTYYFLALSAALSLVWLLKKPNFRRLIIHWLVCLFLLVWRVDFGIASLAATFLILFGLLLNKKINGYKTILSPKEVISSLALSGTFLATLGIFLSLLGGESFLKLLFQNLAFVRIQPTAQAFTSLVGSISPLSVFQYFVLPAISGFYILFFIFYIFRGRIVKFGDSQWLLLFLAIFSLAMSVRSVQRHSLVILGYSPYLFVFLGISIPFYLKTLKKEVAITLFLLMLLGNHFIFPDSTLLVKAGRLVNSYDWKNKESRVKVNDFQYKELAGFLNDNLNKNQTFLDLTSSPLLYVVTNKKFINYFIPSAYYTSEPIQKFTLERIRQAYENNEIPIVVFRQPDNNANNIDGVPNEIRSYRIYEFINKNYKPVGYLNGYLIWIANSYVLPRPTGLIPIKTFSQDFDLKKLPYIWGTFDDYKAKEKTTILASLIKEPKTINPGKPFALFFDMNIDKSSGNYIHLTIRADGEGALKLNYGSSPQSSVNIYLIPSEKDVDYLIRISSQWSWMNQKIGLIELSSSTKIELVHFFIRKGD